MGVIGGTCDRDEAAEISETSELVGIMQLKM